MPGCKGTPGNPCTDLLGHAQRSHNLRVAAFQQAQRARQRELNNQPPPPAQADSEATREAVRAHIQGIREALAARPPSPWRAGFNQPIAKRRPENEAR